MENPRELKLKVIIGAIWNIAQQSSSQLISFIVSVVLARLLAPEAFGLVAMMGIFLGIANVFAESGFGAALVQKKEIDRLDCDSVFWMGLFVSTLIYLILFLLAPYIAGMYGNDLLVKILRVQAFGLIFSSMSSVQIALVSRKLDYKRLFYRSLIATSISGVVGLWMAFAGFGLWALIAQSLTGALIGIVTMWFVVPWHPKFQFSWERIKALYAFGLNVLGSSLMGTGFTELRSFLIGLYYKPTDLAYNNRGCSIPSVVNSNVRGPIMSILFPAMSRLQGDMELVKISVRRSMMTSTFLVAPAMVLLSAAAEQIILIIYTEKWAMAIPFMQVVCFQHLFNIMGDANLQAIKAIGRSDISFKLEFIKKPLLLAFLFFAVRISPLAIAVSYVIYDIIGGLINAYPNRKFINYTYREQLADILPSILLAAVTWLVIYGIGRLQINTYLVLLIQIIFGMAFYFGVAKLLKMESMTYVIKTVREFRNR